MLFDYLENTKGFPSGLSGRTAVEKALEGLTDNPNYLVRDPEDPDLAYPIQEAHLKNPRYWHSNDFSVRLFANIARVISGFRPLFQAGVICGYRTIAASQPKRFQLFRLLPTGYLIKFARHFNKRFNRTKTPKILRYQPGYVRVQLGYAPQYKDKISPHVCDWNAGIYVGHGIFTGSFDFQIQEVECCTKGHDDCVFELTWSHTGAWRRFLIFLHSMLDPDYIMGRDLDNLLLQDSLLRQEGIIEEKTAELKRAQQQLLEQERLMTEAHIAGGMAHEIRNTLGAAKLRLSEAYTTKLIASGNQGLLDLFHLSNRSQDLNQNEKADLVRSFRGLSENNRSFSKTFVEISHAVDRGLAVANRVMTYSMLHHQSASDPVDIHSIIKELRETYGHNFRELGISIRLDIEDFPKIKGSIGQTHAILQNLLLNARDAILEAGRAEGEILIRAFKCNKKVTIEVTDNGTGIPESHLDKIFHPFFSTKPSKGMGLGLNECCKIAASMHGSICVQSDVGEGSTFRVIFPAERTGFENILD